MLTIFLQLIGFYLIQTKECLVDYLLTQRYRALLRFISDRTLFHNRHEFQSIQEPVTKFGDGSVSTPGILFSQGQGFSDTASQLSLIAVQSKLIGIIFILNKANSLISFSTSGNVHGFVPSAHALIIARGENTLD